MNQHWSQHASNPNEIKARRRRAEFIQDVLSEKPINRIERICEIVEGKTVLDVGCVSHEARAEEEDVWLHKRIAKASLECLGIDILVDDVSELKRKGYNVAVHDLTAEPISGSFEMIVCGELVEHLGNIAAFFVNCRESLCAGGQLVISTPYPWFLGVVIRNTLSGKLLPGSLDHVAWFEPSNIAELADRHGFALREISGIEPLACERGSKIPELFYTVARKGLVPFLSPLSGCRSLLYRLEKLS